MDEYALGLLFYVVVDCIHGHVGGVLVIFIMDVEALAAGGQLDVVDVAPDGCILILVKALSQVFGGGLLRAGFAFFFSSSRIPAVELLKPFGYPSYTEIITTRKIRLVLFPLHDLILPMLIFNEKISISMT